MKDKWMNITYEDDELKPYVEPAPDINDPMRIGNTGCRAAASPTVLVCGAQAFIDLFLY